MCTLASLWNKNHFKETSRVTMEMGKDKAGPISVVLRLIVTFWCEAFKTNIMPKNNLLALSRLRSITDIWLYIHPPGKFVTQKAFYFSTIFLFYCGFSLCVDGGFIGARMSHPRSKKKIFMNKFYRINLSTKRINAHWVDLFINVLARLKYV